MDSLYMLVYDTIHYYVEARNFAQAIEKWKAHVKKVWGDEYEGTEEPESCMHVHDEPVIR